MAIAIWREWVLLRSYRALALVAPMSASLNPFYVPPASIGILEEHIVKGSSK